MQAAGALIGQVMKEMKGQADAAKARDAWAAARDAGADMLALPEMFITGYQTQDLVLKPAFLRDCRDTIEALAADMLATMYAAPGVGLAAPQVGVDLRLVVVDLQRDDRREPMVLVNPEVVAASAEEALAMLNGALAIDIFVTDVVMPGPVRSPELARQAKALLPDLEVLFTSGYTENAIVHGGRLDPGVSLLSKPYRREDLARKLRQLLRQRQQRFASRTSPAAPVKTGSLRILLVEDDEDIRDSACELLEVLGHRVLAVASAEAAHAALGADGFDVLFTDVSLPGKSGMELAREAVRQHSGLRVIIASGHGTSVVTAGGGVEGAVLLPKPYALPDLKSALERVGSEALPPRPV